MNRLSIVVVVVLCSAPFAGAQSPQPSPQAQVSPPWPSSTKSPPMPQIAASPPTYQINLQGQIPPPSAPPVVALYAMPQPAFAQTTYVATTVPRSITWGPGPVGLSLAWGGTKMQGFGRVHTITWNHTVLTLVVQPVAPPLVYPQPTSYVATMPGPTAAPGYRLVRDPEPTPQASSSAPPFPPSYYATPSAPPVGPTPGLQLAPVPHGDEAPPAPAPPAATPTKPMAATTTKSDSLVRLGTLLKLRRAQRGEADE